MTTGFISQCSFNCLRGRPRVCCLQLQTHLNYTFYMLRFCFPFSAMHPGAIRETISRQLLNKVIVFIIIITSLRE